MASWYGNTDYQPADPRILAAAAGGGFGGLKVVGDMANQMTTDRLKEEAANRADEMLTMQKSEHQMKVDAIAQAAKEKDAANKYADVLGAATSGNVIGTPDQKLLGDKIASLGKAAETAGLAGDTITRDKLINEQQSYINSVLPKMTKAYEVNPEAQLQVLRGTSPLGGTGDLAPQTRLALLKEAEAPIEKMQATNSAHAAKLEEAKIRAAERANDKALAAQQAMLLAKFNADSRIEIAKMQHEGKVSKDPNNEMTVLATVNGKEILMSPNEVSKVRSAGGEISNMHKIGSDTGSGTNGKGGGGGLFDIKDAEKALTEIAPQKLGSGRKEATQSVLDSRKELAELGVHPKVVDDIITKALMRGQAKTDWTDSSSVEFQPKEFQDTVDEGVRSAYRGDYIKYGIKEPVDAVKAKTFLEKRKSADGSTGGILDIPKVPVTQSVLPKPTTNQGLIDDYASQKLSQQLESADAKVAKIDRVLSSTWSSNAEQKAALEEAAKLKDELGSTFQYRYNSLYNRLEKQPTK